MRKIAGKNLVLIGFMGTGKTEVARLLAEALNRRLVDTDQHIVGREGLAVAEIFARYGEDYFRRREQELIAELAGEKGLVVATGGGMVLDANNVALLQKSGFLVWLDAGVAELEARLKEDTTRPLLRRDKSITELYREREPLYRGAADVRVGTGDRTPLQVAKEILTRVR